MAETEEKKEELLNEEQEKELETTDNKKEKKKLSGGKIFGIIIAVLAIIVIIGIVVINILTKPVLDSSEDAKPIGGMLYSDTIDYKDEESSDGLENNLIVKIMQLVWVSTNESDAEKHADQTPPTNVIKEKDISYLDDNNPYHLLDVYYPEGEISSEGLPVIIDIHGGGWMYATKDLNEYYCMELASRGYIVFSISYRLVPDVTVNEQLQDCAYALKWISENMNNYPANANTVMLTGDSAGGQLAAYSTILNQSKDMREIFDTVETNLNIKCLVLTSPVAYMKNGGILSVYTKPMWGSNYKEEATYDYMDLDEVIDFADDMPPTYFITSSGDTLAHDQTVTAYNLFQERGIESEIADFTELDDDGNKLPHVFSVLYPFSTQGQKAIDGALDFYQKSLLK